MDEEKKLQKGTEGAQQNLSAESETAEKPRKKTKIWLYILIAFGGFVILLVTFVLISYFQGGESNYVPPEVEKKSAELQVLDDLEYLSTAVQSYYATELQYPISLSALVPNYIDSLPTDPLSGKPYIYESDEHTYFKIIAPDPKAYNYKELYVENGELYEKR